MAQTVYFISGLPCTGPTLLSTILRQNPNFHAGTSSPVGALFSRVLNQLGAAGDAPEDVITVSDTVELTA